MMEKPIATASLLQQLTQQASQASRPLDAKLVQTAASPAPNMVATDASIRLPLALQQLLAQHGQIHTLLPQLNLMTQGSAHIGPQSSFASQVLSAVLPLLQAQFANLGSDIKPAQLQQWVSQWFSFNPIRALTQPVDASQGLSRGLGLAIQWLLLQRDPASVIARLLGQSLGLANTGATSTQTAAVLPPQWAALAQTMQGSLQDIRLSQVHLADTSAQQHSEYFLVVPYQSGEHTRELEWLLKREARKAENQTTELWHFSLKFDTQRYGRMLVKGTVVQAEESPIRALRFYLDNQHPEPTRIESFQHHLQQLTQRLNDAGLAGIEPEVYLVPVPDSLAPSPNQLEQQHHVTRST